MTRLPKLLVVDLAAVMNELDALREDWITRDSKERRRRAEDAREPDQVIDLEAIQADAEVAWAETYPALELLRDEVR